MIDAGASVHGRCMGIPWETVLSRACYGRGVNMRIIAYLLEHGADAKRGDYGNRTPLHDTHNIAVAELLLKHDPTLVHEKTIDGKTPLDFAVAQGNQAKIDLLLAYGAG